MHQRALVLALMAAGAVFSGIAGAADDCSQMFVYSVNQFCRTLSNGFSQCQPVGMVGPAPNCAKPGVPPIMPMPLAPPVVQAPSPFSYMAPFPAPGGAVPAAAVQSAPAPVPAPPAAPVATVAAPAAPAKPAAPLPAAAAPVAAQPSASAAVVPPTPAPTPVVAATPAPKQEQAAASAATPVSKPVPVPAEPAAAKLESIPAVVAAPPAAPVAPAIVPPAPVVVAVPVSAPAVPSAQPGSVASTPAAVGSPAPVMPPSITLQDGLAHFDFNRAELSGPSRTELDAWLKQPLPKGKTLRVTGHADRLGPASYNLKLSGRRAETVKKYLVGKGVSGQDIKVVAKGESEPVKHCKGGATKATIDCLAPNRRVEIDPE